MGDTRTEMFRLPHSGLQVPHTKLSLADVETARNGSVFTAKLMHEGQAEPVAEVGTIGLGEETFYRHTGAAGFAGFDLGRFAAECLDADGQPVEPGDVIDALHEEHETTQIIERFAAQGMRVARMKAPMPDGDGFYTERHAGFDLRIDGGDEAAEHNAIVLLLDREHPTPDGAFWELWADMAWKRLPDVVDADDDSVCGFVPLDGEDLDAALVAGQDDEDDEDDDGEDGAAE